MIGAMRWIVALLILCLLTFAVLSIAAGRSAPPVLTITKPDRFVGQVSSLEVTAEAPRARFTTLTISVEQNGRTVPLFSPLARQAELLPQIEPVAHRGCELEGGTQSVLGERQLVLRKMLPCGVQMGERLPFDEGSLRALQSFERARILRIDDERVFAGNERRAVVAEFERALCVFQIRGDLLHAPPHEFFELHLRLQTDGRLGPRLGKCELPR